MWFSPEHVSVRAATLVYPVPILGLVSAHEKIPVTTQHKSHGPCEWWELNLLGGSHSSGVASLYSTLRTYWIAKLIRSMKQMGKEIKGKWSFKKVCKAVTEVVPQQPTGVFGMGEGPGLKEFPATMLNCHGFTQSVITLQWRSRCPPQFFS